MVVKGGKMKVSDRIKRLQKSLDLAHISIVDREEAQFQIVQLEVDIVEALQNARQDGFQSGRHVGDIEGRGI